jgi:hypothetical protein
MSGHQVFELDLVRIPGAELGGGDLEMLGDAFPRVTLTDCVLD